MDSDTPASSVLPRCPQNTVLMRLIMNVMLCEITWRENTRRLYVHANNEGIADQRRQPIRRLGFNITPPNPPHAQNKHSPPARLV